MPRRHAPIGAPHRRVRVRCLIKTDSGHQAVVCNRYHVPCGSGVTDGGGAAGAAITSLPSTYRHRYAVIYARLPGLAAAGCSLPGRPDYLTWLIYGPGCSGPGYGVTEEPGTSGCGAAPASDWPAAGAGRIALPAVSAGHVWCGRASPERRAGPAARGRRLGP